MYGGRTVAKYLGELTKLKQEGHSFDYYLEEFMRLSHQVQELPKDFLIGCFISGLRDGVKYDLIGRNPPTLEEAMRLARVKEEKTTALRKSLKTTFNWPNLTNSSQGRGGPSTIVATGGKPPLNSIAPYPLVKKLSPQEA